jgi:hypothetical protein
MSFATIEPSAKRHNRQRIFAEVDSLLPLFPRKRTVIPGPSESEEPGIYNHDP